jgi:hypothetical protein
MVLLLRIDMNKSALKKNNALAKFSGNPVTDWDAFDSASPKQKRYFLAELIKENSRLHKLLIKQEVSHISEKNRMTAKHEEELSDKRFIIMPAMKKPRPIPAEHEHDS